MALESGQVRKEAALRDAHQVPLLTGGALKTKQEGEPSVRPLLFLTLRLRLFFDAVDSRASGLGL